MKRRNGEQELYTFLSKEKLEEYKKSRNPDAKSRPTLYFERDFRKTHHAENAPKLVFKPWSSGGTPTNRDSKKFGEPRFDVADSSNPVRFQSDFKLEEYGPEICGYRFVGVSADPLQSEYPSDLERANLASAVDHILVAVAEPLDDISRDASRVREYLQAQNLYTQVHLKSLRVLLHPDKNVLSRGSASSARAYTLAFQLVDQLYKELLS